MEKNKNYYGFMLNDVKESKETASKVHYFHHEGSGADLVWFQNKDANKTFGIGFRTPPEDSTGVAHIVEHCVLSGSKKFKTREPFMELAKSSMATFLNAMTFNDMTIYPISSMNDKDYKNLMNVYLDAVLNPDIYTRKEIFMQEGWHHELLKPEDPVIYKGVVYNEMKGAFSSPDAQVYRVLESYMHEGTTYEHESGGYPYTIPELTLEYFLNFHKKYYHPSNSLIFLYGDVKIDDILSFINDEYLSHFKAENIDSSLILKDIEKEYMVKESNYSSPEGYTEDKNSYLSWTVNLGNGLNQEDVIMNSLVADILIMSESSPVKQALLKSNIAEDISGSFDSGSYYQDLSIVAKNSDSKKLKEFESIIDSTIKEMVEKGVDKNLLLAAMNKYEILRREGQGNYKGVVTFISAMKAWLYDKDVLSNLTYDETFKKLREEFNNGYFEKYLKEKVLNSKGKLLITHKPDPDLFRKEDKKEREKLDIYKNSLSEDEINKLIEDNEKLLKFQMTEDSKEDKNTIPRLELTDIPGEITYIPEERKEKDGITYLIHEMNTSSLNYLDLTFDISHIEASEIPYVNYLCEVLGMMDTENYKYSDLNNVILMNTSGIRINPRIDVDFKDKKSFRPGIQVSSSAIGDKWVKILELMEEVLFKTKLDDKVRLKEILNMVRSNIESDIEFSGNSYAMKRIRSFFSNHGMYAEKLEGIEFFDHINEILKDYDNKQEEFINKLKEVYSKLFNRKNMIVSITTEKENVETMEKKCEEFTKKVNNKEYKKAEFNFDTINKKEGITSSSNVQYVSKGADLKNLGIEFKGDMYVLAKTLSGDYLHNAIRARGGAYGAGISITDTGELATFSYRDPNLGNTVKTYDEMANFIENLTYDDDDIRNYVVGSMNNFIQPVVPSQVNSIMVSRFLRGKNKEDIEKLMKEALSTTKDSLKSYGPMLKKAMEVDLMVTLGNKDKVEKEKNLFTEIRPLRK